MPQLWHVCKALQPYIKKISGREYIPTGPCIVVSNHAGPLDSALLMVALRRNVRFVAARHLLTAAWPTNWWHRLVVFKLGRSIPNGHSLETCRQALNNGETLGIFPEGDIHPRLRHMRLHTGAVVLSYQTHLPILPVRIEGSDTLWPIWPLWRIKPWRIRSIRIIIDQPITMPPADQRPSAQDCQRRIDELMSKLIA